MNGPISLFASCDNTFRQTLPLSLCGVKRCLREGNLLLLQLPLALEFELYLIARMGANKEVRTISLC